MRAIIYPLGLISTLVAVFFVVISQYDLYLDSRDAERDKEICKCDASDDYDEIFAEDFDIDLYEELFGLEATDFQGDVFEERNDYNLARQAYFCSRLDIRGISAEMEEEIDIDEPSPLVKRTNGLCPHCRQHSFDSTIRVCTKCPYAENPPRQASLEPEMEARLVNRPLNLAPLGIQRHEPLPQQVLSQLQQRTIEQLERHQKNGMGPFQLQMLQHQIHQQQFAGQQHQWLQQQHGHRQLLQTQPPWGYLHNVWQVNQQLAFQKQQQAWHQHLARYQTPQRVLSQQTPVIVHLPPAPKNPFSEARQSMPPIRVWPQQHKAPSSAFGNAHRSGSPRGLGDALGSGRRMPSSSGENFRAPSTPASTAASSSGDRGRSSEADSGRKMGGARGSSTTRKSGTGRRDRDPGRSRGVERRRGAQKGPGGGNSAASGGRGASKGSAKRRSAGGGGRESKATDSQAQGSKSGGRGRRKVSGAKGGPGRSVTN